MLPRGGRIAQECRYRVLDRGGADDASVSHLNQRRALRVEMKSGTMLTGRICSEVRLSLRKIIRRKF